MSTKLGDKQLGKLVANLQSRASLYTEEAISRLLIRDIYNEVAAELAGIAGTKDKEFYKEGYIIPQTTSIIISVPDSAVSYTSSTRRLIIPAAQTDGTIVWSGETAFSSIFVGASVIWSSVKKGVQYSSVIESVVNGTTVVLASTTALTDTAPVIPPSDQAGTDIINLSIPLNVSTANDINIGGLSVYKYIKYITSIEDSITPEVIQVSEKEFRMISSEGAYSAYANSIIWTQTGDTIRFRKGSSVSAYGIRTMHIVRTPIPMSVNADYIDVRPDNIGQVNDIVLYRVLRAKKVNQAAMPQEVVIAESNLQKQKIAAAEEKKIETQE